MTKQQVIRVQPAIDSPGNPLAGTGSEPGSYSGNNSESNKDPLTGLYLLDAFNTQLNQSIAEKAYTRSSITLLLLQLANFYEIRSWIGNSEANWLLNDVARLLEQTVPQNSLLCHCHNHEFAVLLVNEGSRRSAWTADSIKLALQTSTVQSIPPQLSIKCGVGLTVINQTTPDAEVAFARARHSMSRHHGEQTGERALTDYSPQQQATLLDTINHAIERKQYALSFQAIVSLAVEDLQHYEIRIRLSDKKSNLPAARFLDLVTQNALGVALDQWVIQQAVARIRKDTNSTLRLTVSLTQNSLVSPIFLAWLTTTFAESSRLCSQLVLQISELDVLVTQHHLEPFSRAIKTLGIQLCISHFGSTRDPMRYLPLLNARYIKLDSSRTRLAETDRDKRQELVNLNRDIHLRGMKTIAPMVERIADLPLLWEAGVDYIQGYCLHQPGNQLNFEFPKSLELTVN